jgi:hypothetical protein
MSINGFTTLRAYRKFDFFRIPFMEAIEKSGNSVFSYVSLHRWIGIRLDFICIFFAVSTAAFCVFSKDIIDNKLLTFSL